MRIGAPRLLNTIECGFNENGRQYEVAALRTNISFRSE